MSSVSLKVNNNKNSIKKALCILYIFISSLILWCFSYDVKIYIVISFGLIVLCTIKANFNITNPLVWFFPVFVLYQIAYPWLKILGTDVYYITELNENYVIINWYASVFLSLLLLSLKEIKYDKEVIMTDLKFENMDLILILDYIFVFIGMIYIVSLGFTNKYDLNHTKNILASIILLLTNTISLVSTFYCLNKNVTNKKKKKIFIISSLLLLFAVGIVGERDLLINHLIMFFLYYYVIYKPNKKTIILAAIALIIFVGVSSSLKMFIMRNNTNNSNETSFIQKILTSDFQSAGFNFNYLLNNKKNWNYRYGKTLLYDFFSVTRNFIDYGDLVSTRWYQKTFWSTRRTGLGFSFLAEGLINFDIPGVFIWIIIIFLIIKLIYYKSKYNIVFFIIYISFCPLCMYIMRADLANLTSPFTKYTLLGSLVLYIFTYKNNKERKIKNENK